MNTREQKRLWSATRALFFEINNHTGITFLERPFLENPDLPPVISPYPELEHESSVKISHLCDIILGILGHTEQVSPAGDSPFMQMTAVFDDVNT